MLRSLAPVVVVLTLIGMPTNGEAADCSRLALQKSKVTQQHLDAVFRACSEAIKAGKTPDIAYAMRGLVYFERNQFDQAVHEFNKSLELQSSNSAVYESRARAFIGLGRLDLAINDLTAAIKIAPRDASLFYLRGTTHTSADNPDAALADLRRANELDPRNSNILIALEEAQGLKVERAMKRAMELRRK